MVMMTDEFAGSRRTPTMPPAREYQLREVNLPRGLSVDQARQLLTEAAEVGKWELARVRRHADGSRRITLRRRIIRQESTL
jgi:hypothetical protein